MRGGICISPTKLHGEGGWGHLAGPWIIRNSLMRSTKISKKLRNESRHDGSQTQGRKPEVASPSAMLVTACATSPRQNISPSLSLHGKLAVRNRGARMAIYELD